MRNLKIILGVVVIGAVGYGLYRLHRAVTGFGIGDISGDIAGATGGVAGALSDALGGGRKGGSVPRRDQVIDHRNGQAG